MIDNQEEDVEICVCVCLKKLPFTRLRLVINFYWEKKVLCLGSLKVFFGRESREKIVGKGFLGMYNFLEKMV